MSESRTLTPPTDLQVLEAVQTLGREYLTIGPAKMTAIQQDFWVASSRTKEFLKQDSLWTRQSLESLVARGFLESRRFGQIQFFRLSQSGEDSIAAGELEEPVPEPRQAESASPEATSNLEVLRILKIVSAIEDLAENTTNNADRAQIMGLVVSLKALLDVPEPPKQGILALVRDPAFVNIVQLGTFLAAIVAAVKA